MEPAPKETLLQALKQRRMAAILLLGVASGLPFNLTLSTLQAWLRKASASPAGGGSVFMAVPNLLSASPTAPAYRLQWPGGLSLEVRSGFSSQELGALLQLLPPR